MKKRNRNIFEIKRGILKCKKRLDALKNQGFIFSQDIYDNLDSLEKKIIESSLIRQIWNKKLPIFAGIICILFIVAMIIIADSNGDNRDTDGLMNIMIHNIPDELIKEKYCIQGMANHSNGDIVSVQVKIDEGNWGDATGALEWEYWISIDDLSDGTHNLSFRCWDGIKYSDIKNETIKIQKPRIVKPAVAIHNPLDGAENLSGIVTINGTATAGNGEIQKVEIQFNREPYRNVTGTTIWQINWNTIEVENGQHIIKLRCNDTVGTSNTSEILVTVYNDPPDTPFEFPPYDGKYFQFFILDPSELIKPGETYTLEVYHRRTKETGQYRYTINTILEIRQIHDWLNISLPNGPIVTPPDNKSRICSIPFSINNDTLMDRTLILTVHYTYYTTPFMDAANILNKFPILAQLYDLIFPAKTEDVDIKTGHW